MLICTNCIGQSVKPTFLDNAVSKFNMTLGKITFKMSSKLWTVLSKKEK